MFHYFSHWKTVTGNNTSFTYIVNNQREIVYLASGPVCLVCIYSTLQPCSSRLSSPSSAAIICSKIIIFLTCRLHVPLVPHWPYSHCTITMCVSTITLWWKSTAGPRSICSGEIGPFSKSRARGGVCGLQRGGGVVNWGVEEGGEKRRGEKGRGARWRGEEKKERLSNAGWHGNLTRWKGAWEMGRERGGLCLLGVAYQQLPYSHNPLQAFAYHHCPLGCSRGTRLTSPNTHCTERHFCFSPRHCVLISITLQPASVTLTYKKYTSIKVRGSGSWTFSLKI